MSNDKQQDTKVLLKIKGIPLRSDSYELIDNNSCWKEHKQINFWQNSWSRFRNKPPELYHQGPHTKWKTSVQTHKGRVTWKQNSAADKNSEIDPGGNKPKQVSTVHPQNKKRKKEWQLLTSL